MNLRAISAHRDTYLTAVSRDDALYRLLPAISGTVAQTGLPKLYAPTVSGAVGGPVRFAATARARRFRGRSRSRTRRARPSLPARVSASTSTGRGTRAFAPPGAYTWVISAGGDRARRRGRARRQARRAHADGRARHAAGDRRQRLPERDGELHAEQPARRSRPSSSTRRARRRRCSRRTRPPARSRSSFTPTGLADGNYSIRLTARDLLGRQAQATRAARGQPQRASITRPTRGSSRRTATGASTRSSSASCSRRRRRHADARVDSVQLPAAVGPPGAGAAVVRVHGAGADGLAVPDGVYTREADGRLADAVAAARRSTAPLRPCARLAEARCGSGSTSA